jgi:hypothetical protein
MRELGWRLERTYSDYISLGWRTTFGTGDPAEVERYCRESLVGYRWHADGVLSTAQLRPGVITHPTTGEQVWFNHLAFWNEWSLDEELRRTLLDEFGEHGLPFNTALGDGTSLTQDELHVLQDAYDAATLRRTWEAGDLLLVDNVLMAHGRDAFRGDRRIVVAMGEPVELAACRPTVPPAAATVGRDTPTG